MISSRPINHTNDKMPVTRNALTVGRLTTGSILIIGILGSLLIIYATKWGPWVYSDSTEYIVSARNLVAGHGLGLFGPLGDFHPMSLHPPFYSLLLGFFGWIGVDLLGVARWVNVVLFGLTIIAIGLTIYNLTRSVWLSIVSSMVLFTMPDLVDASSGAMSEPLFIFTGLLSTLLVLLFLKYKLRSVLILAAIAAGLSIFTRYIGIALMLTGIFVILTLSERHWKNRVTDALIFGSISSMPTILWLLWLKSQSVTARMFQNAASLREQLVNLRLGVIKLIWNWIPFSSHLPPYSYSLARNLLAIAIILLIALTGLTIWKMHKNRVKISDVSSGMPFVLSMIIFAFIYLVIFALSYIYTFPTPDLINRILFPVQISLILGFFGLCYIVIREWSLKKGLALIPILFAVGICSSYLADSFGIVSQYHQEGGGFTGQQWRSSDMIPAIDQLPADISLITNEPAAVLFLTNRPAYDISEISNTEPASLSRYGDDQTDPIQVKFRSNQAALVLFDSIYWQFYPRFEDQTEKRLQYFTQGLNIFTQTWDGTIYFYNPPK